MARRIAINFKEVKPIIVGPAGVFQASRMQRFDMPTTFPSNDIDELGHRVRAGTTTDVPEVTLTFQAMDVSIKLFAALTGTDPTAYPANGVSVTELGELDAIAAIKDAALEDIVKTVICRKAQVTGFTYSYSADGDATEEYTAQGSDKRWFKNDIITDTFTTGTGPFTLTQTPIALKTGDNLISVIVDGVYFTEVAAAPGATDYTISGTTLNLGTAAAKQVLVVYHASPAGNNWTDILDTTIPAAVRGKNIPIKLMANQIDRVQSVTVRGSFPTTAVKELGNTNLVGYVVSPPTVEGDISVLDTDTELVALFATGALNPADTEFKVCEFTASGISLEVIIKDPATSCNVPAASGTVLKTVYIPEITITSEGHTSNVGGNATQTFGWKSTTGECLVFSGARP